MRVAGTSNVNPRQRSPDRQYYEREDTPDPQNTGHMAQVVEADQQDVRSKQLIESDKEQIRAAKAASVAQKVKRAPAAIPAASDQNVINKAVGSTTIVGPGRQRPSGRGKGYEPADLLKGIQEKNMELVRNALTSSIRGTKLEIYLQTSYILAYAIQSDCPTDILNALLDANCSVNQCDPSNHTPLLLAADRGHEDLCKRLLSLGATADGVKESGHTPLGRAANGGHFAVCKHLLDGNANVDLTNSNGATPLAIAALRGHEEVVALLLERNADPNIARNEGRGSSSLIGAVENGHVGISRRLIEANANVDHRGLKGWTALCTAAVKSGFALVRLLLDAQADPNLAQDEGASPLCIIAEKGLPEFVTLLVDHNADVHQTLHKGWRALRLAAQNGHVETVRRLIAARADVNHRGGIDDVNGCALSESLTPQVASILLRAGADCQDADLFKQLAARRWQVLRVLLGLDENPQETEACQAIVSKGSKLLELAHKTNAIYDPAKQICALFGIEVQNGNVLPWDKIDEMVKKNQENLEDGEEDPIVDFGDLDGRSPLMLAC